MKVMLGDPARDTVTGFEGTVVKVLHELHGVDQVAIERADAQGVPEQEWFNAGRVEPR